ncbi:MAG: hypothetical protein U0271_15205 [Polyangiaceae bacterium]
MVLRAAALVLLPLFAPGFVACTDEVISPLDHAGGAGGASSSGGAGGAAPELYPLLACDPLVPSFCGYPFPSNVTTIADAATPTGRRIAFQPGGIPVAIDADPPSPDRWSYADGFSSGSAIIADFPDAVGDGLPSPWDLDASLDPASPTVLIDMEYGTRVPHWSEIDHDRNGDTTAPHPLLIHPAIPLRDGARYAVAIRGLVDASGNPIPATEAFAALRDELPSTEPSIEARRPLYDQIFGALEDAGVARDDLLLAWDFTTASRASNTGWLVHMRDDALDRVGDLGPTFTITSDMNDTGDTTNIAFKLKGTMHVPLYLDDPSPGGALRLNADGMPEPDPANPDYDVEFEILIPVSALSAPAKLLQFGHGLLGSHEDIESEHLRTFINQYNYVLFATKWIGLAEEDEAWIGSQLALGRLDTLTHMFDRFHQGVVNSLLLMRMMKGQMAADPTYGAYIDKTQRYYWGISQGGIAGGVYMALSTDVERGVLEVMGQPYSVLLNRSVDFDPFFTVLGARYPDARAQQLVLGMIQMQWDRVEPTGYTKYIFTDPFPGSPGGRKILMRAAVGDHQVSTFGAHVMARALGATVLDTQVRDVWGLTMKEGPIDAQAVLAEYDFGLPPEPTCDLPMTACEDPHGVLRKQDAARIQADEFLRTGKVVNACDNGVCDFSALSGCDGTEDPDPCD